MCKKAKTSRKDKTEALELMINFAEGRISTDEFWEIYKNSLALQTVIIKDKTRKKGLLIFNSETGELKYDKKQYKDSIDYFAQEKLLDVIDINILEHRHALYQTVRLYFWRRKANLKYKNADYEKYEFLQRLVPRYVYIRDSSYIESILNEAPKELSTKAKIKYSKEKIRSLFRYDNSPPRWLQAPEWPIKNGQPLVFSHQEKITNIGDYVKYYFYDAKTNEQTIVEQFT